MKITPGMAVCARCRVVRRNGHVVRVGCEVHP